MWGTFWMLLVSFSAGAFVATLCITMGMLLSAANNEEGSECDELYRPEG